MFQPRPSSRRPRGNPRTGWGDYHRQSVVLALPRDLTGLDSGTGQGEESPGFPMTPANREEADHRAIIS